MLKRIVTEAPFFKTWVNLVQSGMYCLLFQAGTIALAGRIALVSGKTNDLSTRTITTVLVCPPTRLFFQQLLLATRFLR